MKLYGIVRRKSPKLGTVIYNRIHEKFTLSESRCKDEENSKEGAIFASSKNGTFLKCYKCATYW